MVNIFTILPRLKKNFCCAAFADAEKEVTTMVLFDNDSVNLSALRKKAYNFRWAEVEDGVIPLTAADPDFPVAKEIPQAIIDYVSDGYFSYTPKMGLPAFRESIARHLREVKNEEIAPELVLPIDSAARGMYVIAQTVLSPGDEAIVFDPVDYLFKNAVLAAGAVPVFFPTRVKDGKVDFSGLEQYITPKTKMICLCNPHNPLGKVYPREDLEHILALSEKYNLWIMNDEIWSDIILGDKPFLSILSLGAERNRRTLSVYGFSKAYGVAGLRIGAIYCTDEEIFRRIVETSTVMTTAGGISSLSQVAGIACLDQAHYWTEAFLEHLRKNCVYAVERINKMSPLSTAAPEATYLLWIDISKTGLSNTEFVDFMREKAKLALVAGSEPMFGPGGEGFVRLCFATSRKILTEGLDRLEKGIKLLAERS